MKDKSEVWQGTLAIMVLKTLDAMGEQHGYGIARRIEQISNNLLSVNHGRSIRFAQAGAGRFDRIVLGRLRQPPQGTLLSHYESRKERAGGGAAPLAADH
jgi:hypothetical protein